MEGPATNAESSSPAKRADQRGRLKFSIEFAGEFVLLALVGVFFVYLFIESLSWPLGSALMPWIALAIGAPFWLWRIAVLFFLAKESSGQIMDIGFRIGDDPEGHRGRFIRICCYIVGLYLAIWLLGFHIGLPAGILFYVRVYGKMSWFSSILLALFFVVLIVGVYDRLLNATWHEAPLLQWIFSFFPESG